MIYWFAISAEKIHTTSPIQPKKESKPLRNKYENKDTSAFTVEHKIMENDQPVKCKGKTENNMFNKQNQNFKGMFYFFNVLNSDVQ